jgi:hypothetical protein
LSGLLEAAHSRSRLVLAQHPAKERWDAFWLVAGRVVDWGELPSQRELRERTERALASRPARSGPALVAPDEVDEIRIVHSWIAAHEPPSLALEDGLSFAPSRLRERFGRTN